MPKIKKSSSSYSIGLLYRSRRYRQLVLVVILTIVFLIILLNSLICSDGDVDCSPWSLTPSSSIDQSEFSNDPTVSTYSLLDLRRPLDTKFDVDQLLMFKYSFTWDHYQQKLRKERTQNNYKFVNFYEIIQNADDQIENQSKSLPHSKFNMSANDVMVFLHIQKTGKSFAKAIEIFDVSFSICQVVLLLIVI